MSVWKPTSAQDEPVSRLERWAIFRTPQGDYHFCGYCGEGRVSSKIMSFDLKALSGRTRSGRLYQLEGRPGLNRDAMYVLGRWIEINGLMWDDIFFVEPELVIMP